MLCEGPVRGEAGSGKFCSRIHPPSHSLPDILTFFFNYWFSPIVVAKKTDLCTIAMFWYVVVVLCSFIFFSSFGHLVVAHNYYSHEPEALEYTLNHPRKIVSKCYYSCARKKEDHSKCRRQWRRDSVYQYADIIVTCIYSLSPCFMK